MTAVFPTPHSRAANKVKLSGLLGKNKTAVSPSAGAPKVSGSITEQHANNNLLRYWIIHLRTRIGVEFIQYVGRTLGEDTLAILDSSLSYPSSHLPLFFLISSFSSVIHFMFLLETRRLVYTHLLFLCALLPPSVPFPHR